MSRCLGDLVAPLADGTLSPSARERALAHVAGCPRCRAELDDERGVRSLLAEVAMPEVPMTLLASLTAIPDRPAPLPTPGLVPPPPAVVVDLDARRRRVSARRGGMVTGAAVALAASAGLAMLAGAPQAATSVPVVVPDAVGFAQEHTATVGGVPMVGPGLRVAPAAGDNPVPAVAAVSLPVSGSASLRPTSLTAASLLATLSGGRADDALAALRSSRSVGQQALPAPAPARGGSGPLALTPVSASTPTPAGP